MQRGEKVWHVVLIALFWTNSMWCRGFDPISTKAFSVFPFFDSRISLRDKSTFDFRDSWLMMSSCKMHTFRPPKPWKMKVWGPQTIGLLPLKMRRWQVPMLSVRPRVNPEPRPLWYAGHHTLGRVFRPRDFSQPVVDWVSYFWRKRMENDSLQNMKTYLVGGFR